MFCQPVPKLHSQYALFSLIIDNNIKATLNEQLDAADIRHLSLPNMVFNVCNFHQLTYHANMCITKIS